MREDQCCTRHKGKVLQVSAGKSKFTISNKAGEAITICDVDGCIITDNCERCDKLVQFGDSATLLVELKGRDIEKARKQLEASLRHDLLRPHLKGQVSALVICSKVRVPRFNSFLLKSKQHFMRNYNCRFHVKCSGCSLDREGVGL